MESSMEKLDRDSGGSSLNIVQDNIDKLKTLFPEVFAEGKIDFDALRDILGDAVEAGDERYNFSWHGKAKARRIAQTPSTGTLLPCKAESKNWDTTQNLFIEGDNLEVLKLLQKSYHKQVKMIYIDPPYNTGKEFIYPDNYQDNLDTYLEYTGQKDSEGRKFGTNAETSGRYHTNWLNMMYPRLKLARNLLRDDGVIFISIDDNEQANLRKLCDEVFGEENFVAAITLLCNPKGRSQDKYFATNHEYVTVYSKKILPKGSFAIAKGEDQIESEYPEEDEDGKFRLLELRNTHREFGKHNRKNLFYSFYVDDSGEVSLTDKDGCFKVLPLWDDGFEGCWTWDTNKAEKDAHLLVAKQVNGRWKIYRKSYANGADRMLKTILFEKTFHTEKGQKEFNTLFNTNVKIFQSPKSPFLIGQLSQTSSANSDVILDFFSGSCTTAHAVMDLNAQDGGNRRFVMVQLPEPCDEKSEAYKAGYKTIADIGKERIRRAGDKIKSDNADKEGIENLDIGFKVFKLSSSNIKPWDADFDNIENTLLSSVDNIKDDRREDDVLYEILLKYGLDLTVPIEEREIGGKAVYSIGFGALAVCLDDDITLDVVEGIGKLKAELDPEVMRVVFKDSGFKDDVVKTNAIQILKKHGIDDVKSL